MPRQVCKRQKNDLARGRGFAKQAPCGFNPLLGQRGSRRDVLSNPNEKSFPVTWDQFHRDSRALAWRLASVGPFDAVVAIVSAYKLLKVKSRAFLLTWCGFRNEREDMTTDF